MPSPATMTRRPTTRRSTGARIKGEISKRSPPELPSAPHHGEVAGALLTYYPRPSATIATPCSSINMSPGDQLSRALQSQSPDALRSLQNVLMGCVTSFEKFSDPVAINTPLKDLAARGNLTSLMRRVFSPDFQSVRCCCDTVICSHRLY